MIITLTGANSYGLQRELRGMVTAFLDKYDEMGLERVDGEESEFNRLSEALTSLPFLVERKLVVLRAPGANKQFVEKAEALLAGVPETTDVVIVEPKLDKRGSYYKLLKKSTDYREFPELDAGGMARWLTDAAKAAGGSISPADARLLVERVGINQALLANELDKLLLHEKTVTRQSIELLTEATPQSTIFELLDAAFAGNARRAMALYAEQRALKVEPQQLHVLAVVKTAGSRTPDDIARESKVSAYTVKKSVGIARRLSLPQLKAMVAELLDIDRRLKRESIDADEAMQNYLLRLAS
jgi:DNA polymerase III delta subunit